DLQLQLLISESEKQVAIQKLQYEKSRLSVTDFTSYLKSPDEVKRRQKVGNILIELLTLIGSNNSLQSLLEIGSLESFTKVYDQGKCYKLLKKLIKPFTLLIKYLLSTQLTDNMSHNLNQTMLSQKVESPIPQYITQQNYITPISQLHNHNKFQSSSSLVFPNDTDTPDNKTQSNRIKTTATSITRQTQTHNDPLQKKIGSQIQKITKV
ncbi:hypothetical protein pb186bvf_009946, partial [Paramecium bursaria]